MSVRIRVAVIGANWGLNHIEAWRAVPGVEVAAVCTSHQSTAEAAARAMGIGRPVWNAEEIINDPSIDVIDVTPRPEIRVPLVIEALTAGKHVMQPLPFAQTLEQAESLLASAGSHCVVAAVENLHRFSPAFLQAHSMITRGDLGRIFNIHAHVRTGILIDPGPGFGYNWITEAASGASSLRNFGAHLLHVLTWLFGDVESVCADLRTRLPRIRYADGVIRENHTEDSALALLRLVNGATASIEASWSTSAAGEGFLIDAVGEMGRLQLSAKGLGPQAAELRWAARGQADFTRVTFEDRFLQVPGLPLKDEPREPRRFPLASMCFAFAQAVMSRSHTGFGPTFAEAAKVMQVVEAAYRSHESGGWVKLSPGRA